MHHHDDEDTRIPGIPDEGQSYRIGDYILESDTWSRIEPGEGRTSFHGANRTDAAYVTSKATCSWTPTKT